MKPELAQIARARSRATKLGQMQYLTRHMQNELNERLESAEFDADSCLFLGLSNLDGLDEGQTYFSWIEQTSTEVGASKHNFRQGQKLEAQTLPYENETFSAVIVNLELAWLDPGILFQEVQRVLKPRGMFLFSTFGPDTLIELARAWGEHDDMPHVHEFIDMHHLGDALQQLGFKQPILETDRIKVTYEHVDQLLQDIKAEGVTNCHPERRKNLTGVRRFNLFKTSLNQNNEKQAGIPISFELIYGFALKAENTSGSIRVEPPKLS